MIDLDIGLLIGGISFALVILVVLVLPYISCIHSQCKDCTLNGELPCPLHKTFFIGECKSKTLLTQEERSTLELETVTKDWVVGDEIKYIHYSTPAGEVLDTGYYSGCRDNDFRIKLYRYKGNKDPVLVMRLCILTNLSLQDRESNIPIRHH